MTFLNRSWALCAVLFVSGISHAQLSRQPVDRVYYAVNDDVVRGPRGALDALVSMVKENPKDDVLVIGHADATERDPAALSKRRAAGVRGYLIRNGVPEHRIKTESRGASNPSAMECKNGGAKNRRVELVLLVHI